MKVIIDIPKKDYNKMCKGELINTILVAIKNGKSIPDNATNGDMIKAMFPRKHVERIYPNDDKAFYDGLDYLKSFHLDWWNAPYKAESEV